MDLGTEFYEQWNWQRFREAESMELEEEEEDGDVAVIDVDESGVREEREEGGSEVEVGEEESRKMVLPQYDGMTEEKDEVKLRKTALPQYDGPAEDADESEKTASISKMHIDDVDARSSQVDLPRHNDPVEDIEESSLISKTMVEDVDESSYGVDTTISDPPPDKGLNNDDSEVQEQSVVMDVDKSNKDESGVDNSDKQDGGEEKEEADREMTIADESISYFLVGDEHGDEEVMKVGENATRQEDRNDIPDSKIAATETTIDSGLITDVDFPEKNSHFQQVDDKIEEAVSGGKESMPEKNHNDASRSRKAIIEMEVETVIDKFVDQENDGPEKAHVSISTLTTSQPEMITGAGMNGNTDSLSGIEGQAVESSTTAFLSNEYLRDLEGKPSSISAQDQSPVKFTTQDGFSDGITTAVEETTDEHTLSAKDIDNAPVLTQTQYSSITDQTLVDDTNEEDIDLPPLPRTEAPVQIRQIEIPDSDAMTESSQQSPQKVSHVERASEVVTKDGENAEIPIAEDAIGGENGDGEIEGVVSSFGRECDTSSIHPNNHPNERETMTNKSLQNGTENVKETKASLEVTLVDSAEKVMEDSKADAENNMNVDSPSAQSLLQKKTNKRGRPGRKASEITYRKGDEEKPIEKKAKLTEDGSDHMTSMEVEDNLNACSPFSEKKKRGRPSSRKVSALSIDEPITELGKTTVDATESDEATVEKTNRIAKETAAKEKFADKLSPSSPAPEKKKRGRPVGRKISTLSAVEGDESDIENADRETVPTDERNIYSVIGLKLTNELATSSPIHSTQEKKRRGRPPTRKSSSLSPEKKDAEEAGEDLTESIDVTATAPSDNIDDVDSPTINDTMDKLISNSPSPIKRRRGRPASRKSSGLGPEKEDTQEVTKEIQRSAPAMVVEETRMNEATLNNKSTDDLTAILPSSAKGKRGRPAGRKSSGIVSEKTEVRELPTEFSSLPHNDVETQWTATNRKQNDFPATSSPVLPKRRGRPARKASGLSPEKATVDEPAQEIPEIIATEDAVVTGINKSVADVELADELADEPADEPAVTKSSPEKKKRGRLASRKSSALSPEGEDIVKIAEKPVNDITTTVSEKVVNANINECATNTGLSVNSSPEKRKRGRPARKISSLNIRGATKERISDNVNSAGKDIPIEIVDSDEEADELQDESPPAKKLKPEKKERGRPSRAKTLVDINTEDTRADEEELTAENSTRDEGNKKTDVDTQIHDEPSTPEKKKRGRPSAIKARRVSNIDSEVSEGEQPSEKIDLPESEEPTRAETDEQEPSVTEKKKRGRPVKNKGKEPAKASEPIDDENVITKDATSNKGSSRGKISGSQVSTSSNTSSSSQTQNALFAELKAMKIVSPHLFPPLPFPRLSINPYQTNLLTSTLQSSIQARNAKLTTEIAQKRSKIEEITGELKKPAKETVKRHIKLLHDYNDIKDVGQGLVGMIADNRGVRVGGLYGEFGVGIAD